MSKEKEIQELEKKLESLKALVVDLDENDKLKIQNVLLKKRLLDIEKKNLEDNLYDALINKYDIDTQKYIMEVDNQAGKITLKPR